MGQLAERILTERSAPVKPYKRTSRVADHYNFSRKIYVQDNIRTASNLSRFFFS